MLTESRGIPINIAIVMKQKVFYNVPSRNKGNKKAGEGEKEG